MVTVETFDATSAGALTVTSSSDLTTKATPNVTFVAGQDRVTTVVVPVGADGQISVVDRGASTVDVRLAITGQIEAGPHRPGGYTPVRPTRVLTPDGTQATFVTAGSVQLLVAGRGQVPTQDVAAVALSVTVLNPAQAGQMAGEFNLSGPTGDQDAQMAYQRGVTSTATVISPVNASGYASLWNLGPGGVYMSVDVVGYLAGSDPSIPDTLVRGQTTPVLDTRPATNIGGFAPLASDRTITAFIPVSEYVPLDVSGVVVAVSTRDATGSGTVTVAPPAALGSTASVGYRPGQVDTNQTVLPLAADRSFTMTNTGSSSVDVVVTVVSYLTAATSGEAVPPSRQGTPADVVADDADQRVFVSDPDTSSIYIYSVSFVQLIGTIPNQSGVRGLSLHNGTLYTARSGDGIIGRIDPVTLKVGNPYARGLPAVSRLAWSGSTLWAADHQDTDSVRNTLWSIDPGRVVHRFLGEGEELAVSPAYPGTLFEALGPAGVERIDISSGTPTGAQSLDVPTTGGQLAVSPDGKLLYVAGGGFCAVRIADEKVIASRLSTFGTGAAVAVSATTAVLGQDSGTFGWTAAFTNSYLGKTPLLVGGGTAVRGTFPHGIAIADGVAFIADRVANQFDSWRLASYRLP